MPDVVSVEAAVTVVAVAASASTAIGNSSVSSLKSMLLWLHDVVHFNAASAAEAAKNFES